MTLMSNRWMLVAVALGACANRAEDPPADGHALDGAAATENDATTAPPPAQPSGASAEAGPPPSPSGIDAGSPDAAVRDDSPNDDAPADAPSYADGSSRGDAANEVDAASPHTNASCKVTKQAARCDSEPVVRVANRPTWWAKPSAAPPPHGYPAVLLYQGTLFGPSLTWGLELDQGTAFGGYYQLALVNALLNAGFVVVQPEADGSVAWATNYVGPYEWSADANVIPALLEELAKGTFGKVDVTRLYATGISSGGYMTSRMAVSYPGKFRALAIESASYATCAGPLCNVPNPLPSNHPPTLFLHGAKDGTVGIDTARAYEAQLKKQSIEVAFIEDLEAGHQWLPVAPDEITRWFLAH